MVVSNENRQAVRRVLLITLVLNLAVAFGKIALGIASGALAITADGFHSLADSAGNIAGLVGNVVAGRPPDDDHPYGHERFETLAALFIGGLLLLTAWEVAQGVIARLEASSSLEITPLTFAVLVGTLLVNIGVSRYQIRRGKQLNSEILLADARNTSADVFVTLSVLGSTGIVALTGWVWIDVGAAFVVILLIGHAAWGILKQTGSVLVDTAPFSPEQLTELVIGLPGVYGVERARSRGSVDAALIDIDVHVAPEMTAEQTDSIALAIRRSLEDAYTGIAEIEVHFVPYHPNGRDASETARAFAAARGLATHEVTISHDRAGIVLEMHVEVPPEQTLAQAHDAVTRLEAEVEEALPEVQRVVTHIEPAQQDDPEKKTTGLLNRAAWVEKQAVTLLKERFPQVGWHEFATRPLRHGFAMNLHVALPAELSVESAHNLAESAETMLRSAIPELLRVTIHTEPEELH